MKKTIQILIILVFWASQNLSAQGFEWAKQVELLSFDNIAGLHQANDVAADNEGNVYMAGRYLGTQKFGDVTVTSSGIDIGGGSTVFTEDGFIAKYDEDGNFVWIETFPSFLLGNVQDIELDDSGNIYALLNFSDSISVFGNQVVGDDGFVVLKMDANRNLLWYKSIIRDGSSQLIMTAGSLVISATDVFISTITNDEVSIDGTLVEPEFPVLLASFNNQTGGLNWTRSYGNHHGDLATDAAGDLYWVSTVGSSLTNFNIGGVTINSMNGPVLLFVKILANGDINWVKTINNGKNNPGYISQVEVNPSNGNIYVAGTWGDTLKIDDQELISSVEGSIGNLLWVAQFNSSGNIQWVKSNNLPPNETSAIVAPFIHIASSSDGGIFVANEIGYFEFSLGEGANEVFFGIEAEGFIAKYAPDGSLDWGQQLNCTSFNCDISVRGLVGVDVNKAVITGNFQNDFELGDVSLTSVFPGTVSQPNMYLVKVDGDLMTSTQNLITEHLQFNIIPNPADEFFQVKIENVIIQNGRIEILDLMGRVLFQTSLENNNQQFPIGQFSNGTYFLRLSGNYFYGIQKLVIQK